MSQSLTGIASMATRHLLAQLSPACAQATGHPLSFTAVGGVLAAQRVRAGDAFDLVALAQDVIADLVGEAHVDAASVRPLVHSHMAIAVSAQTQRLDIPTPDISTVSALRQTLREAARIGYSTGPSGVALLRLLQDWQLVDVLRPRLVQAPPGVSVAQLIAQGQVDLGFQQLAELQGHDGVAVLGPMPAGSEIVTTFAIGVGASSAHPEAARDCLEFLCSAQTDAVKRRCALEPAARVA